MQDPMVRAAPEHVVDCSHLDTTLFEAANRSAALLGASWIRDLGSLTRTEHADLGNPPTEAERFDAWQDPGGREQQEYGYHFPQSPDPDVVPAPPTPERQLRPHHEFSSEFCSSCQYWKSST